MKYQNDYTFTIVVKDQFGMDVSVQKGNIDELDDALQMLEEEIEEYDRDLTGVIGRETADDFPDVRLSKIDKEEEIPEQKDEEEVPSQDTYEPTKTTKATAK
jgi:hypothetical protein